MSRLRTNWQRGDRGAVLIEAALTVPIFFALLFALADFSIAEVGNSSGANAAREGARVAILNFADADHVGSANYNRVVDAVNSRLEGLVEASPTVNVACLKANGTTATGYGCSASQVKIGSDLIKVSVSWTQKASLGFISNKHRTDSAVMRIVGPTKSSSGGGDACTLSNPTATPASVGETGGTLDQTGTAPAITFSIDVNSMTACGVPLITLPAESGLTGSSSMVQKANTNQFTFAYPPSSVSVTQSWTAGAKTAQIQEQGGAQAASIPFTVNAPTPSCTYGTVTPNPLLVRLQNKNSDKVKSNFSVVVKVPVSSQSACSTPPQVHTEGLATTPMPAATPATMVWSGSANAYTLTISSTSLQSPWHDGESGSLVIAGDGGTTSIPIQAKG